jgi:mannose/fructose-specific phosphotransferase system component IIA
MVIDNWKLPTSPNYIPPNVIQSDPNLARMMLEIIEKLDALDKKVNAIDCKLQEKEKEEFKQILKTAIEEVKNGNG